MDGLAISELLLAVLTAIQRDTAWHRRGALQANGCPLFISGLARALLLTGRDGGVFARAGSSNPPHLIALGRGAYMRALAPVGTENGTRVKLHPGPSFTRHRFTPH